MAKKITDRMMVRRKSKSYAAALQHGKGERRANAGAAPGAFGGAGE
jgi:hypothetical protein